MKQETRVNAHEGVSPKACLHWSLPVGKWSLSCLHEPILNPLSHRMGVGEC